MWPGHRSGWSSQRTCFSNEGHRAKGFLSEAWVRMQFEGNQTAFIHAYTPTEEIYCRAALPFFFFQSSSFIINWQVFFWAGLKKKRYKTSRPIKHFFMIRVLLLTSFKRALTLFFKGQWVSWMQMGTVAQKKDFFCCFAWGSMHFVSITLFEALLGNNI